MLTNTKTSVYLTRVLLDEILPPLEAMEDISQDAVEELYQDHDWGADISLEFVSRKPTDLCLDVYICGAHRCLLGWTVEHEAFKPYIVSDYSYSSLIDWERTADAIYGALEISPLHCRPLFSLFGPSNHGTIADRRKLLEEYFERIV